jgi:hypothetical protein
MMDISTGLTQWAGMPYRVSEVYRYPEIASKMLVLDPTNLDHPEVFEPPCHIPLMLPEAQTDEPILILELCALAPLACPIEPWDHVFVTSVLKTCLSEEDVDALPEDGPIGIPDILVFSAGSMLSGSCPDCFVEDCPLRTSFNAFSGQISV